MSKEPEIQALLQQTAIWNAKADYSSTINKLSPDLLSHLGSAELYMQAGQAKFNANEKQAALDDFTKAIELSPNYAMAYYNRGTVYYYSNETKRALSDYDNAIRLDPQLALAYLNRGNIWYTTGQPDKAFDDYSTAIRIDPAAALAYYGRGNVWFGRNEFLQAIPDYDKAILYSPGFMLAYNNRGLSWLNLRNYGKALQDFKEALRLAPESALIFNNIGLLLVNEEKYEEAINKFDRAIQLDPYQALAYFNRGLALFGSGKNKDAIRDLSEAITLAPNYAPAWYRRGTVWEQEERNTVFEKAIEDYRKAIALDPGFGYLQPKIDELLLANAGKETAGEKIPPEENIFSKILASVSAQEQKNVSELASVFLNCINKIKDHTRIKTKCAVAHYSKLLVADLLFMDEKPSYLHYSNVAFMNDPEEGKVLKDVLLGKNPDAELQDYFRRSDLFTSLDLTDANVYLGSFLPASADQEVAAQIASHEDELVMWRTYGKDENNNEAAGCSIIISSDFFAWPQGNAKHQLLQPLSGSVINSQEKGSGQLTTQQTRVTASPQEERNKTDMVGSIVDNPLADPTKTHVLYRVLYYNRATGVIENRSDIEQEANNKEHSLNDDIKALRNAFMDLLKKSPASERKSIDQIIAVGLSELRYFFKSANYAFENEYRVVKYHDSGDPAVMIEDRKIYPKPLYIRSEKPLKPYVKKIYLGPKVQHPERWNYLEVALKRNGGNKDVRVLPSTCKFQ